MTSWVSSNNIVSFPFYSHIKKVVKLIVKRRERDDDGDCYDPK